MSTWKTTIFILGVILLIIGISMFFPIFWALYYKDSSFYPLFISAIISLCTGGFLCLLFRQKSRSGIGIRQSMAAVTLSWFFAGIFGALPFYLSKKIPSFTDCFFETVSGFTTTGASILTNIEAMPKGLLMWRSLTHWLGGMGIILLSLIILPLVGLGGFQLYKAEVPGPIPDKLKPKLQDTAKLLWKVYLLLTISEIILLLIGGMNLFDSIAHTFGTLATGGFSTKNLSIGHYNSSYLHYVITIFMFLAGANFALHYKFLLGSLNIHLKDSEFRFYTSVTLSCIAIVTAVLWITEHYPILDALKYGSFQVVSILTTTGYATDDFEKWPSVATSILFFLMFLGGCAGSTGGGIKFIRILVMIKHTTAQLQKIIHPRAVISIKIGGQKIPNEMIDGIWAFFFLYLSLSALSVFLVSFSGVDMETSIYATIACIGNIGPGFAQVGPMDNYAHLPMLAKWILSICMILGRLEIYTVIIMFSKTFWEK